MKTSPLGDRLTVSALTYGAMGLVETYGPANDAESLDTLHHTVDVALTFIDTAACTATAPTNTSSRDCSPTATPSHAATKFGIVRGLDSDDTTTPHTSARHATPAGEAGATPAQVTLAGSATAARS